MPADLPEIDPPRRRLRLAARHLRALQALLAPDDAAARPAPDPEQAQAEQELQDAGLLAGEHLHPLVLDHLRVLLLPTLQLAVEVVGPLGGTLADVVVSGTDVWHSEPWPSDGPDGCVVWQRSELATLLWDLARLVGLRSVPVPPDEEPLHGDLATVDGLLAVLATADPDRPLPALTTVLAQSDQLLAHLPAQARVRWTSLLASWQASWRVTVAWGRQERSVAVLDCGDEGYWRRDEPRAADDPDALAPDAPVLLRPTGPEQLWRDLAALLPSSAELRAAAASPA